MQIPKGKLHEGQLRSELQVKDGGFAIGSLAATCPGEVEDKYDLDSKKVGEGGFGAVRKARCKDTGKWRAVKSIARSAVPDPDLLREEISIMRLLDHPHIVRLSETFEDSCWVYLVMELCEGGELFQQITEAKSFDELVASNYTRQMLLAVNYLHQNRIIHRDLKPENFLLANKGPVETGNLKLIDFGFAKRVALDEHCETLCGTLLYIAPEVLGERYDFKADVWSLGIIVYLMLSGRLPWSNTRNNRILMQAVKEGVVTMDPRYWWSISDEAHNLVELLLTKDVEARPQAVHALQHCWVAEEHKKCRMSLASVEQLKAFGQMNTLKKAAADVLVTQLPESEIKELKTLFMEMDTNKDGAVSLGELKKGLAKSGVKLPKNLPDLVTECDLDGSGVLDYTEFLAAVMDRKQYHQKDVVWAAFKRFDQDGSGFIDKKELCKVVNQDVREAMHLDSFTDVDEILAEVDSNKDDRIDFDEFFEMMSSARRAQDKVISQKQKFRKKRLTNGRNILSVSGSHVED